MGGSVAKGLDRMTKRELLAYAESIGITLSSATRLRRGELERAIRKLMADRGISGG